MNTSRLRNSAVVVCGHPLPADAAENVLREGGNAYDALAAAWFVACFAEPLLASVAGGGFFMLQPVSQRARVIDCFVQTPRIKPSRHSVDSDSVELDFGGTSQSFQIGWGTVAVPGMVRGIYDMHRQLGRMDLKDIILGAVESGRQPIVINECQGSIFRTVTPVCLSRASAASQFGAPGRDGEVVTQGDVVDFTALADTLEVLAIEGEDFFYRGEIAALFDTKAGHGGGAVTRDDLRRYEAKVREVQCLQFKQTQIALTPVPSAGGLLVGFGLNVAQASDCLNRETSTPERLLHLIDIMRATSAARLECADVDGADWPDATALLAQPYIEQWGLKLRQRARGWTGTTHMSVIDAAGNIASLTTSNGSGCGEILDGTGIMPNNMLGEADLSPRGPWSWDADTRMSSMMTPTIISRPDGSRTTLGSGGSSRIRSAMLQVITNIELLGMAEQQAVDAPRVHVESDDSGSTDRVVVEGGFDDSVVDVLTERYPDAELFNDQSFYFGGVHVASHGPAGVNAGADPRRGGSARIITL